MVHMALQEYKHFEEPLSLLDKKEISHLLFD
jgi:hypothetical protein